MGINIIVIIISYILYDLENLSFYKCHLCESTKVISFELELARSQYLTVTQTAMRRRYRYTRIILRIQMWLYYLHAHFN